MISAISQDILDNYMIRKGKARKTAFISHVTAAMRDAGYEVTVTEEKGSGRPRNIVIGDPATARLVFTGHYDTPATLPFPNFAAPGSLAATLLYLLAVTVLMAVVLMAVMLGATLLAGNILLGMAGILAFTVGLMILMMAGPDNKNNYNDNTSGVITVLETALALPKEARADAAFVLFDLEELGLVGSRAFAKRHGAALDKKLVVNFDCVSDGDDIVFCLTKDAKKLGTAAALRRAFQPTDEKRVRVAEKGFFFYPSDQLSFKNAAAGCALRTTKRGGLQYLSRIHTKRDTVFDERNIVLLKEGCLRLAESI